MGSGGLISLLLFLVLKKSQVENQLYMHFGYKNQKKEEENTVGANAFY